MSENVDLKIELSSQGWEDRYPETCVCVNDIEIFSGKIVDATTISWNGDIDSGKNKISIELKNKQHTDTVVDDNGNIVNDVLLNIDNISIDSIDIEGRIWSANYYVDRGNGVENLDRFVCLGWNGRWELEFDSPTFIWFLET